MKKIKILFLVFILFILINGYKLEKSVVSNGGIVTGDSLKMFGYTIGQFSIGELNSNNKKMEVGFWNSKGEMIQGIIENSRDEKKFKGKYYFSLGNIYPNPLKESGIIEYSIPQKGLVRLVLYDINGKKVKVLLKDYKEQGKYFYELNVKKQNLPNGVYLYRLEMNGNIKTKKFIILK